MSENNKQKKIKRKEESEITDFCDNESASQMLKHTDFEELTTSIPNESSPEVSEENLATEKSVNKQEEEFDESDFDTLPQLSQEDLTSLPSEKTEGLPLTIAATFTILALGSAWGYSHSQHEQTKKNYATLNGKYQEAVKEIAHYSKMPTKTVIQKIIASPSPQANPIATAMPKDNLSKIITGLEKKYLAVERNKQGILQAYHKKDYKKVVTLAKDLSPTEGALYAKVAAVSHCMLALDDPNYQDNCKKNLSTLVSKKKARLLSKFIKKIHTHEKNEEYLKAFEKTEQFENHLERVLPKKGDSIADLAFTLPPVDKQMTMQQNELSRKIYVSHKTRLATALAKNEFYSAKDIFDAAKPHLTAAQELEFVAPIQQAGADYLQDRLEHNDSDAVLALAPVLYKMGKNPELFELEGKAYMSRSQWFNATSSLEKATSGQTDLVKKAALEKMIGDCYIKSGHDVLAANAYESAITKNPSLIPLVESTLKPLAEKLRAENLAQARIANQEQDYATAHKQLKQAKFYSSCLDKINKYSVKSFESLQNHVKRVALPGT